MYFLGRYGFNSKYNLFQIDGVYYPTEDLEYNKRGYDYHEYKMVVALMGYSRNG